MGPTETLPPPSIPTHQQVALWCTSLRFASKYRLVDTRLSGFKDLETALLKAAVCTTEYRRWSYVAVGIIYCAQTVPSHLTSRSSAGARFVHPGICSVTLNGAGYLIGNWTGTLRRDYGRLRIMCDCVCVRNRAGTASSERSGSGTVPATVTTGSSSDGTVSRQHRGREKHVIYALHY